jgi:predicted RNA-binding Zn ribbon-like protein
MRHPKRSFPFHHGRSALSFVGTVGDRGSDPVERLDSPDALADWLAQAALAPREVAVSPRAFARALRLREAIARAVDAIVAGRRPDPDDIGTVNAAAKAAPAHVALDPATLRIVDAARDPLAAALGRVARDAIELLGDPEERGRLRTCGLDACGSVFLTPAGRRERRWCSMERCGNRAKVSAYRDRQSMRAR